MRRAAALLLLGLGLCALAGAFAARALYVPGIAIALLAALAGAWVWLARHGTRLTRWTAQTTVDEDAALQVVVALEHGRSPFPGGELIAWPGAPALPLNRSLTGLLTLSVDFPRRGRHMLGPALLCIRDPLGIAELQLRTPATEILVLPRVEPVQMSEGRRSRGAAFAAGPTFADAVAAVEVDALAPHTPGAPASRIHWPTVARTGTLVDRRLVADADGRPLIVIDPRHAGGEEALDAVVRATASLCVHLATRGGCALLLPGERRAAPIDESLRAWPALHVRLAVLDASDAAPWWAPIERSAIVLWVTAASGGAAALARCNASVRYLVTPHPAAGRPVAFTVAGCAGQRMQGTGSGAGVAGL